MEKIVNKTVKLTLLGLNGNIFNLLAAFSNQAFREGWTKEEMDKIENAVFNAENYSQALAIIETHCES